MKREARSPSPEAPPRKRRSESEREDGGGRSEHRVSNGTHTIRKGETDYSDLVGDLDLSVAAGPCCD